MAYGLFDFFKKSGDDAGKNPSVSFVKHGSQQGAVGTVSFRDNDKVELIEIDPVPTEQNVLPVTALTVNFATSAPSTKPPQKNQPKKLVSKQGKPPTVPTPVQAPVLSTDSSNNQGGNIELATTSTATSSLDQGTVQISIPPVLVPSGILPMIPDTIATSSATPQIIIRDPMPITLIGGGGGGGGSSSAPPSAPPPDPTPPPPANTVSEAPSSLIATAGNTSVALSWSAPASNGGSAITDYTIHFSHFSTDSFSSDNQTFSDGVSNFTNTTVTGLLNGTSYSFKVFAVNSVGESSGSNTVSAIPLSPATVPSVVSDLNSDLVDDSSVRLTWSSPSDGGSPITGYEIKYDDGTSPVISVSSSASPKTVSSLSDGTTYFFKIFTVNNVGTSTASNTYSTTTTSSAEPPPPE
ncbi:MAG: fibronectin type III domain-containing protein [Candidatus Yonathbacteria bacterium]|nr:fibronectin type III domain-containing protein [Candidatus Yonathbacteria bacterium]